MSTTTTTAKSITDARTLAEAREIAIADGNTLEAQHDYYLFQSKFRDFYDSPLTALVVALLGWEDDGDDDLDHTDVTYQARRENGQWGYYVSIGHGDDDGTWCDLADIADPRDLDEWAEYAEVYIVRRTQDDDDDPRTAKFSVYEVDADGYPTDSLNWPEDAYERFHAEHNSIDADTDLDAAKELAEWHASNSASDGEFREAPDTPRFAEYSVVPGEYFYLMPDETEAQVEIEQDDRINADITVEDGVAMLTREFASIDDDDYYPDQETLRRLVETKIKRCRENDPPIAVGPWVVATDELIFGTGNTPEEAREAAREWLDIDSLGDLEAATQGFPHELNTSPSGLWIVPATERLVAAVAKAGGQHGFADNGDRRLDIAA